MIEFTQHKLQIIIIKNFRVFFSMCWVRMRFVEVGSKHTNFNETHPHTAHMEEILFSCALKTQNILLKEKRKGKCQRLIAHRAVELKFTQVHPDTRDAQAMHRASAYRFRFHLFIPRIYST